MHNFKDTFNWLSIVPNSLVFNNKEAHQFEEMKETHKI